MGFIIIALVGIFFISGGIYFLCIKGKKTSESGKAISLWSNTDGIEVTDIRKYYTAIGKLAIGYGIIAILLGIPTLGGQNTGGGIITVLGMSWGSIGAMVIYTRIEGKYKK